MELDSLKHLVMVVKAMRRDGDLIVFGSSSLLASYPEEGGKDGVLAMTFDSDFIPDPYNELEAQALHDAIGRDSTFPTIHGYYADIVRPMAFENFPPGWRERVIALEGFTGVWCLEPHDMAAAKCLAGRPKDIEQLSGLAAKGKLDLDLVYKRLWSMELTEKMIVKSGQALTDVRVRSAAQSQGALPPSALDDSSAPASHL